MLCFALSAIALCFSEPALRLTLLFACLVQLFGFPDTVLLSLCLFEDMLWCSFVGFLKKWVPIAKPRSNERLLQAKATLKPKPPVRPPLSGLVVTCISRSGEVLSEHAVRFSPSYRPPVGVSCVHEGSKVVSGCCCGVFPTLSSAVGVDALSAHEEAHTRPAVAVAPARAVDVDDVASAVDDGAVPTGDEGVGLDRVGVPPVDVGVDDVPGSGGDISEDDGDSVSAGVDVGVVEDVGVVLAAVDDAVVEDVDVGEEVPALGGDVPAGGVDEDVPAVAAVANDVAAVDVDDDDVFEELSFLFTHLSVDDPFDEDTRMAPPFDWRYIEPIDDMEVDDDLLSVMSISLGNSPFFNDEDPIMIDMPSPQLPSRPATPPPSPPPSPTPIPMEVDMPILSPIITTAAATTTTNTATTTTTIMPTPTMPNLMPDPIPVITTDTTRTTTNSATTIVTSPPRTVLNPTMALIQSRIQRIRQTVLTTATPSSTPATTTSVTTTTTTNAAATTSSSSRVNADMPPPPPRPRRTTTLTVTPRTTTTSTVTSTPSSSGIVRPDMPPPPPRPPRATATPSSSSHRLSSSSSSSNTANPSPRSESAQQQQQTPVTTTSATPPPSLPTDVREAQEALGLFD
ncbi:hypothetical protein O0I10_012095 [Lichtheimia ornata]|uniref:Uncharacterized protein n=1 Tax=Lichtheimia ornata TaxID=688661 RepID=A0AAD7XW48_9FUNG|nr:uncharacterized protein O0I10_012095 [Lichtheimia ornata]KAJ8652282.1 hypothetical protein O0I10_012095 [Lichtheimia ornata]